MEKIHENMHVFVLSCKFHESSKTWMFSCRSSIQCPPLPPLHHNGKGSTQNYTCMAARFESGNQHE